MRFRYVVAIYLYFILIDSGWWSSAETNCREILKALDKIGRQKSKNLWSNSSNDFELVGTSQMFSQLRDLKAISVWLSLNFTSHTTKHGVVITLAVQIKLPIHEFCRKLLLVFHHQDGPSDMRARMKRKTTN